MIQGINKIVKSINFIVFLYDLYKKLFTLNFLEYIIRKYFEYQRIQEDSIMLEDIKQVLVDALDIDENLITPDARLKEDLDIDSLAAVELSLELETEFDVQIEDEELEKLVTVQDIIDIIKEKQA